MSNNQRKPENKTGFVRKTRSKSRDTEMALDDLDNSKQTKQSAMKKRKSTEMKNDSAEPKISKSVKSAKRETDRMVGNNKPVHSAELVT